MTVGRQGELPFGTSGTAQDQAVAPGERGRDRDALNCGTSDRVLLEHEGGSRPIIARHRVGSVANHRYDQVARDERASPADAARATAIPNANASLNPFEFLIATFLSGICPYSRNNDEPRTRYIAR